MAERTESLIATRKFARVLGDETDPRELSLEEACKWARDALNSFKVFVEKALDQNVFELLTPEALETLKEILRVACDYDLEVEYPATIVPTGGTLAQKTAAAVCRSEIATSRPAPASGMELKRSKQSCQLGSK